MTSFAVKVINLLELDECKKALLVNELIVLQTTKHKNLAKYYESFLEHSLLFVSLQLPRCLTVTGSFGVL
jgi:hypothetical protein